MSEINYSPKRDIIALRLLSLMLLLPLLIEVVTIIVMGNSFVYTIGLYVLYLLYAAVKGFKGLRGKDIGLLLAVYAFYGINYMLFPTGREYFFETNVLMVYGVSLPMCAIVFRKIENWNLIFDVIKPFALAATVIALYIAFRPDVWDLEEYFSYMQFSYFMLPFVCLLYAIARRRESSRLWNIIYLASFCVCALAIILYGARATFFFILAFIAIYEFSASSSNISSKIGLLFIFGIIILGVALNFDSLVSLLSGIPFLGESRFIQKMVGDELLQSAGRDMVYDMVFKELNRLGLGMHGMFGERILLQGMYPHNIAFEMILQYGWILGTLTLAWIVKICGVALFKSKYPIVAAFFICAFLGRYLLSGSYAGEGYFWVGMFCIVAISKKKY